ncbi:MAG TPA: ribosomal protein S18-alanine N-acetyltransferase [Steroidobacteraceae bacterium]|jgi:ribosomal-protein-alanine N-acetyltransferase|nr:ribosomal protein S18-alanine N-acetyltransferase [Steroidobacteraceae bacterium]
MAIAPELLDAAPEIGIRPMTEADVAEVFAVERASYQFPWSEGIFRDCLRVGYVCRVLALGNHVIGYGVMSVGAGEAHVLNLCVADTYRCRGLGRRMLGYLLERGTAAGMSEAFLEVRPSNVAAIRLYQAIGFEQVGMRRGYYQAVGGREDAAVLRLALRGRRAPRTPI